MLATKVIIFFIAIISIFNFTTGDESMPFNSIQEDAFLKMKINNVRDYGAEGNGSTDDTNAIQAAIDDGGVVFFPPGSYKITSTLTMETKTSLRGAHGYQSKIYTTLDDVGIKVTNDADGNLTRLTNFIEDLYFIGSQTNTNDVGLQLYDTSMTEVRNCYFRNFGKYGLHLTETVCCTLKNVHFYNAALWLDNSNFCVTAENIEVRGNRYPAIKDTYDSTFRMIILEGMTNVAYVLVLDDAYRVIIEKLYQESNTASGLYSVVVAAGCDNLRFIDSDFQTATGATYSFYTGSYLHQRQINFEGCRVSGNISILKTDVVAFDGCKFGTVNLPRNAIVRNPRPNGIPSGADFAVLRDPTMQIINMGERIGLETISGSTGMANKVVADSDFTAAHYLIAESGAPTLTQETSVGYDDSYCASIASSGGACVAYFDKAHLYGNGAMASNSVMAAFMIKADAETAVTLTWENVYNGSNKANAGCIVYATTAWRQVFFRNRSVFSLDAGDATDTLKLKFGIDSGKIYIDRLHFIAQANSIPPSYIDEYQYVPVGDAKVTSAATLNIGTKRNHWLVTGTTNITDIADACDVPERIVYLEFEDELTVTHSNDIYLAEGTNFTAFAGAQLVLRCDADGDWHELSRSVGTAPTLTGLTIAGDITQTGNINLTGRMSSNVMSGGVKALTFSSTISANMNDGNVFVFTATGDCTINASNGVAGQQAIFVITEDAAGGHVVTFGASFKSNGTLTGTAGKIATVNFVYDGTNWCEVSRTMGL